MKRTILAAGAATLLACATLVGTAFAGTTAAAAASSAEPTNSWASRNATVHNAPSLDAPVSSVLNGGTPVSAQCVWIDPTGTGSDAVWFRIATQEKGGGWVPRDALGGVPELPGCNS